MSLIEVPANEQRDIGTVTAEIRQLTAQGRQIAVAFAVEIGRRLVEAKSLLPHGAWGDWLRDSVDFSQRTANNFVRVFEEYGDSQITLFGAVANSQTFANLSVSKALALLALPEEERESFAEEHSVEAMSTRELNDAIRAKLDAERERDAALAEKGTAEGKLAAAEERAAALEDIRDQLSGELERVRILAEQGDPKAAEAAKLEAREVKKRAEELAAELEKAKETAKKAREKLKALKENPEIPEEAAGKLRAEGAAEAQKQAAEKLEKLKQKAEEARQSAAAAEERAAALEKQLATAAPELIVFKECFTRVQEDIGMLQKAFEQVRGAQPETAEKLKAAIAALAEKMKGG